eukprot:scaffold1.g5705.t1
MVSRGLALRLVLLSVLLVPLSALQVDGGYVEGLRVGQLPDEGQTSPMAAGDAKLLCANAAGGSDLIIDGGSGSDVSGLVYANVTLAGGSGADSLSLKLGDYQIASLGGAWSLLGSLLPNLLNGTVDATLTCPAGKVIIGLEVQYYTYASGLEQSSYAQMTRIRAACAAASEVTCPASCGPGQQIVAAAGTCQDCAAGTYKNTTDLSSCLDCEAGYYAASSGAASCAHAPLGSKVDAGRASYTWCGAGYVGNQDRTDCSACPAGYWRPGGLATDSNNVCHVMPGGELRLPAASHAWRAGRACGAAPPTWRRCARMGGYYPLATAAPATVTWEWAAQPGGANFSVLLHTAYLPCPSLHYRAAGDPRHAPQENSKAAPACAPCGPGRHTRMLVGATQCTACDPGFVNPGQTQAFDSGDPGAALYDPRPGNDTYYGAPASADLGVGVVCQACPEDTSQSLSGQAKCAWCPAGQGTTTGGAAVCKKCPLGSYSTAPEENCKMADPGYYCDVEGATYQTACKTGSYTKSAGESSCDTCPSGSYAPSPASQACLSCSAGTYSNPGVRTCKACPPGTFNSMSAQPQCVKAPAGHFAYGFGNREATPCPAGQFTHILGMPACLRCAVNTYQPLAGKTSCIPCCHGGTFGVTCFRWTRGLTGSSACMDMHSSALGAR